MFRCNLTEIDMRLVTRSDFDGLGCAVLLDELGMIDSMKFVHPKDVQDGLVEVNSNDILANIPYIEGCGLWFDHHSSETEVSEIENYEGKTDPNAKSAARVVYEYYGGKEKYNNERIERFVEAVDKADSADFTAEEVLHPTGWVLLSFIMDPRTGLGRYKDYRISNYQLMEDMVKYCKEYPAEEILEIPDVNERVVRYFEQQELCMAMILKNSTVYDNVVVLDLRNQEEIYTGNRFLIYSLFEDQNISLQVMSGYKDQNTVITCGHSILNKTSKTNVGQLMKDYGGGGHDAVGTCQVPNEHADEILQEIINKINMDDLV